MSDCCRICECSEITDTDRGAVCLAFVRHVQARGFYVGVWHPYEDRQPIYVQMNRTLPALNEQASL